MSAEGTPRRRGPQDTSSAAEIDAWFAAKKPAAEPAMRRIREILLAADPRIEEYAKYGSPHWGFGGDLCTFVQPDKKHVTIMFHRGRRLAGTFPHLTGTHPSARFMEIADIKEADKRAPELTRIVAAWCALPEKDRAPVAPKAKKAAKAAAGKKTGAKKAPRRR